jgi:hypothetical protein
MILKKRNIVSVEKKMALRHSLWINDFQFKTALDFMRISTQNNEEPEN